MSEQPEALRLANLLDFNSSSGHFTTSDEEAEAAAELRRLHALCEEMGDVIEMVADLSSQEWQERDGTRKGTTDNLGKRMWFISDSVMQEVKKASAKWKESK